MSDIEIAQAAKKQPIADLAQRQYGIAAQHIEPYGHFKAKLSLEYVESLRDRDDGHLILVTAISPTPAGEGKTTTTVGLGDALNRLGKRAIICLREPSLGPCFGVKGGAAGGGFAQLTPMEDINLHFTGDFHAISAANNLLAAIIDNYIHHGNEIRLDLRRITLDHVAAPLVGEVMLELTKDLDYDAVGGLTLGADPVATAMMHVAARNGKKIDSFVVRKAEKAHGLQRRIEGPDVKGKKVLAVEDTSTTGGSVLTAVEALLEAGAIVVGVAVIVERGAKQAILDAGYKYYAAYSLEDFGL